MFVFIFQESSVSCALETKLQKESMKCTLQVQYSVREAVD